MIALYTDGRVDLDASLDAIETAVRGLDGVERTLVVVELPSGTTLTLGGGPDRVVAELSENEGRRWCVIDPRQPDRTVTLTLGGERVDVPARLCIDKEIALEAVRTFVSANGARNARLAWDAQPAV